MVAVSLKKNFFKQKTAYEISLGLVGSEMCIRDSTGNAARTLGLTDRGFVSSGMSADLLVLDWEHFSARENLADPRHGPQGLDYVLVAGQTAVDHGVHTHVRSGTVLGPEHRKGGN